MQSPENSTPISLSIQNTSKEYLRETAKWSKFLSIVGFITIGIMLLITIFFVGTLIFSSFNSTGFPEAFNLIFIVVYLLIASIYLFPCLYLYKSSRAIKKALISDDSLVLEEAFKNQKSFFKFIGIFTAITLAFYAVSLVVGIMIPRVLSLI